MTTFRAAYIAPAQSAGILLTTEDQAHLSDAELTNAALEEARNAGLIGTDEDANQITEDDFRDQLVIGDWTE